MEAAAGTSPDLKKPSADESSDRSRRVYVGNLAWDTSWQDLKDHMRSTGLEVLRATILTTVDGRSKGCGLAEFATAEDAAEAVRTLTDTELMGRQIFVREDREERSGGVLRGAPNVGPRTFSPGQDATSRRVYVGNLAWDVAWQGLKDHMRRAGNVDSATILTNAQGESVCCGVVVYQKPQEAARAIRELQGSELNGMPLKCREDRERYDIRQRGRRYGRGSGGRGGRGMALPDALVYVGNLAPETTWRDLKDHFRQCGDIRRAEVVIGANGQSRGYGSVQFSTKSEADAAIQRFNGSVFQGRTLEVRLKTR